MNRLFTRSNATKSHAPFGRAAWLIVLAVCLMIPSLSGCGQVTPLNYVDETEAWEKLRREGYIALTAKNYSQAEKLYGDALVQSKKFVDSDLRRATSLSELADVLVAEKRFGQAERLYSQSLPLYEHLFQPGHFDYENGLCGENLSRVLSSLANIYRQDGRYLQAESAYARALAILKGVEGSVKERRRVASEYASMLRSLNRSAQAAELEHFHDPIDDLID